MEARGLSELKKVRKREAHRRRRLVYDNDGSDVFLAEKGTPEALLVPYASRRMIEQIDSFTYCVQWSLGMHLYDSKIGEVCTGYDPDTKTRSVVPDLIADGTDPLRIMVEFYHRSGEEILANFRMNDIHDANADWELPRWKIDRPELLFGTVQNQPPNGRWSGADFSSPYVRNLEYGSIEDVCRRYDVDGIFMDFQRHPPFFKRVAWNGEVTSEETSSMTELIRRIRKMSEDVGLRRGRPILIFAKVLGSVEMNSSQGLDVEGWLREELIDAMVPGWIHESPLEDMTALAHRYDVPVYAHMHRIGGHCRRPDITATPTGLLEVERACAMHAWSAGSDGLFLFNYAPGQKHLDVEDYYGGLIEELGDPQKLRGLDKLSLTLPLGTHLFPYCGIPKLLSYITVPQLSPENPRTLRPGNSEDIWYFPVGDDLAERAQTGVPDLRLQVHGADLRHDNIEVRLNGTVNLGRGALLTDCVNGEKTVHLEYELKPEQVRRGNNRFEIFALPGCGRTITLTDLRLHIKYR